MKSHIHLNKRALFLSKRHFIIWMICSCCLCFTATSSAGPPLERKRDSLSVGVPMKGSLKQGEVLPKRGKGYILREETKKRRARFGVFELVLMIKEAAHKVQKKYKDSLLVVGDLSQRRGGRIDHHGSHQNGRDVDLLFYLKDKKGKSVVNHNFIPIDNNGFSTNPPMTYQFDTARNWALVSNLIKSKKATVQWIFVSNPIKKLLLEYAKSHKASPRLIRQAKQILHQPGKNGHVDHFHVRIYCPRTDRPSCRDVGPKWAWAR